MVRLWPLHTILALGPVVLVQSMVGSSSRSTRGHSDRVFASDLVGHAISPSSLAQAQRVAKVRQLQPLVADFVSQEKRQRRLAFARSGPLRPASGIEGRSVRLETGQSSSTLLAALRRHAQDDLLLARIELSDGRDRALRRLARETEAAEARVLAGLDRLAPS